MATLLIAVVDEKSRIPAPNVTRAVIVDLAKMFNNDSDKIRHMQEMNKNETLKACNLRLTWRYVYED